MEGLVLEVKENIPRSRLFEHWGHQSDCFKGFATNSQSENGGTHKIDNRSVSQEHTQVQALWTVGTSKWWFLSLYKELAKWKWWNLEIDSRSVRTVKVKTIKMKGFQARSSLQSTTASRGNPKQGPSSSPLPTMSSSPRGSTPRSAHQAPSSLNSPFLQKTSLNDSSLNSPFLQGPSLNEIENCLTGLSAEEMEQVGDYHSTTRRRKLVINLWKRTKSTLIFARI